MSLLVVNQGLQLMIDAVTGKVAPATPWSLKLFANNRTPAAADTEANYTEATGGGYAAKALTAANWSDAGGDPITASYAQQTFTFTGALTTNPTIYGYYVVDNNGLLIYVERLATPFTPANAGDTLAVTLTFSLT